jgi:AIPR protein
MPPFSSAGSVMSSLKVNQIKARLRALFEPHLDVGDLSPNDSEKDQKILSRCLAAFAVYAISACTPEDAAAAVWDGSGDNGIDAAYFDQSDHCVIFVQSKWIHKGSGEPEAKDLGPFINGVKDAIEQNQENFGKRVQARLADILVRINTPGTSIHLALVTTGSSTLAKPGQAVISQLLTELNGDDPDEIATSEIMGLSEVYSKLANDPLQGNLTLDAQILDWSRVNSPYAAYFGLIDGLQLKTWWKKHGKGLVAANIRQSLGATEVNNEIKQTAATAPANFWYFNNGITLIADEAAKAPANAASQSAGQFSFRGASIVNGAQTVSSLSKVDNDANLGKVRVPIRIILLKSTPAGFGNEVTRTNNLQNRIESRDFVAQDPQQKRIREEMAVEGIDYQFVRSEDVNPTATSCELIEVTTALACASGDPTLAVQVKTGIGRFFNDLTKPPYKSIFNPSISGAHAFNATVVNRQIEGWMERKKKTIAKKSGTPWGALIHGNRILASAAFKQFQPSKLSKPIKDFASELDLEALDKICEGVYRKIVKSADQKFPGKFLALLFKNPSASKQIFDDAT